MRGENCPTCPYPECPSILGTERKRGVKVAVIVESPGEEENAQGEYLVGPTGAEFERTLNRAGIARSEVAIWNASTCYRAHKSAAKEVQAVSACRDRVRDFLLEVQPRAVLLLGGKALRSVCPAFTSSHSVDGLLRHRGSLWSRLEIEAANSAVGESSILPESVEWVMATIHLAAIIKRERIEKQSAMAYRMIPAKDLRRLLDAVKHGRMLLPLPDIEDSYLPSFNSGEGFVFDLETDGNWRINLIGVQGLDGGPVFSAEWNEETRAWARETFARGDLMKVGHNIQGADLRWLEEDGIEVAPPYADTMALGGLCEPDLPRGLFFQASLYFGHRRPYWKELATRFDAEKQKRTTALRAAWRVLSGRQLVFSGEQAAFYNALDVDSDRVLYNELMETCRREGWR